MKQNLYKLSAFAMAVAMLSACAEAEDPDNPANFPNNGLLQVKAALNAVGTGAAYGDQIGLFVFKNTTNIDTGKADHSNIGCTSQGPDQYWKLSEEIPLDNAATTVFAYYPLKTNINNPKKIPVDITQMEDISFGVNNQQTVLNREQPVALITMKHALAKIRFNLILDRNEEYYGSGIIENARVVKLNDDGSVDEDRFTVLTLQGLLDATTGHISTTASGKMPISMLVGKEFTNEGFTEEDQPFFYSCPEANMKDVAFAIVIDGKQHLLRVEEGSEWRAATINTYTFRLKGESLVIDQSGNNGFTIKAWEETEKEIDY